MIYLTKQDLYDFIPGFTMGFIKGIISHPFEVMKLRSQLQLKDVYSNLLKGISYSIIGLSLERGIQFYTFEKMKQRTNNTLYSSMYSSFILSLFTFPYNVIFIRRVIDRKVINSSYRGLVFPLLLEYSRSMIGSTVFMYSYDTIRSKDIPIYMNIIASTSFVWLLTYPFDSIKNRIIYNNNIDYRNLYRGIQYPILRSIPSSVIGFYVYKI